MTAIKDYIKKELYSFVIIIVLVAVMVGVSEAFSEPEIIFPEVTAIAIGALFAPRQSWNVTKGRILLSIAVMSVTGVLIVRLLPDVFVLRTCLGFVGAGAMVLFTKSGFFPMISACILPIVLGTTTFIYPMSAVVMTLLIIGIQYGLEKKGMRQQREFVPHMLEKKDVIFWGKHLITIGIFSIIAMVVKERLFMVPPLIVAYIEMSVKDSPLRREPVKAVIVIGLSAVIGTFSRLIIAEQLGLGLVLAAVIAVAIILCVLQYCKMYLPPAGAIATLPMLLELDKIKRYPLECIIGFIILTAIGLLVFDNKKK